MTKNRQKDTEATQIQIRKGALNDLSFIKECLTDSWVEHAQNNPDLMTEEKMRDSNIEEFYRKVLGQDDNHIYIAEIESKQVGLIRAYEEKIADFFKDNNILYIDDVYVVSGFRGKGIARRLLIEIENIAKVKGVRRIDGRVYTYNKPMQKLLKSMRYNSPYATWVKIL